MITDFAMKVKRAIAKYNSDSELQAIVDDVLTGELSPPSAPQSEQQEVTKEDMAWLTHMALSANVVEKEKARFNRILAAISLAPKMNLPAMNIPGLKKYTQEEKDAIERWVQDNYTVRVARDRMLASGAAPEWDRLLDFIVAIRTVSRSSAEAGAGERELSEVEVMAAKWRCEHHPSARYEFPCDACKAWVREQLVSRPSAEAGEPVAFCEHCQIDGEAQGVLIGEAGAMSLCECVVAKLGKAQRINVAGLVATPRPAQAEGSSVLPYTDKDFCPICRTKFSACAKCATPQAEESGGVICSTHGKACLMMHVDDDSVCEDFLCGGVLATKSGNTTHDLCMNCQQYPARKESLTCCFTCELELHNQSFEPQAGVLHTVDKAFFDLTVRQRDSAWKEIEVLKLEIKDLQEELKEAHCEINSLTSHINYLENER